MIFEIPGRPKIEINHVVLDYNGTIAIDGQLIEGVSGLINELSSLVQFHVLTADTYGSVARELADVNCSVKVISEDQQDQQKLNFVKELGAAQTMCVGNGKNDKLMLQESVLGIAVIQSEGLFVETMLAADIVCSSVLDVFGFFKTPNRLKATLRN